MSILQNFYYLVEEKQREGFYTISDAEYITNAVSSLPANKQSVEMYLNILDLFDEFLEQQKYEQGVENLEQKNREKINNYILSGDLFSTPLLDYVRDENEKEIKLMKGAELGTKGVANCRKCHLDNLHITSKQTRSGDEGETVFFTCLDCGFNWHE
jgi:DNA-directed RNA polymerase subunit M/transcription elongation factor TFIIS